MILLAAVVALLLVVYCWYAAVVGRRNKALEALSGVDVQLQQRGELIPNILEIAKKFMEHEKGLLTEITALRSSVLQGYDKANPEAVKEHLHAAEALQGKMQQLMIQVENYPQLKSDQTMVTAMQTYNEVEAQISAARRFYNSAVNALNNSVQIFPGNLIANMAGIQSMPFYEAPAESKAPVSAKNILNG